MPAGPSPIGPIVSLVGIVIALLLVGYPNWHAWQRIADRVRYDRQDED